MDNIAIMNAAREKYRLRHLEDVKRKAEEDFGQFRNEPLFVAGIMLYWAEGRKSSNKVGELGLSNSDPDLLKTYYDFLRKYFKVADEKIHARIFLYPDLDREKVHRFWSRTLNIPTRQFIRHTLLNSRSKQTKNKLPYGTCCVYVHSKDMCVTMQTWIEKFTEVLRG